MAIDKTAIDNYVARVIEAARAGSPIPDISEMVSVDRTAEDRLLDEWAAELGDLLGERMTSPLPASPESKARERELLEIIRGVPVD